MLLTPATGVDSEHNFSWNYERLFDQQGIPWCASDQFGKRSTNNTNIEVRGDYVTYGIRKMSRMAGRKIAVMGHSQGGMVMRWPLRFWPDTRKLVDDVIGMAGTNHGTIEANNCATQACTAANAQQAATSNFIAALNSRAETFKGISYTELYSNIDEVVTPQPQASSVSGPGDIANISIQSVCPDDPDEHLGIGTISPTAAALALDALTHRGPADPGRIDLTVCAQKLQPGINPSTFAADVAAAAAQLETSSAPERMGEPRLRCYVFKDVRGCRQRALPQALSRQPISRPRACVVRSQLCRSREATAPALSSARSSGSASLSIASAIDSMSGRRAGIPERAVPSSCEVTSRPLRPSRTTSFIGGSSLVITGWPKAIASYRGRPSPSQREGVMQTSQAAIVRRWSLPGLVAETQLDPLVAAHLAAEPVEPVALDLRLDEQPQVRVLRSHEGLDHRFQRFAMADEAAREDEVDDRAVLALGRGRVTRVGRVGVWREAEQLGMDAPRHARRLQAHVRVAHLLGLGHRVDRVVGLAGAGKVLGGEVLPDEAPDDADAAGAQGCELGELVVLVAEQDVDRVVGDPRLVLGERHLELRGLGDAFLVPDPRPLQRPRSRPLLTPRPGEHERLMPELVDRRAHVAANDRLTAVEPLRHDPHPHNGTSSAAPAGVPETVRGS